MKEAEEQKIASLSRDEVKSWSVIDEADDEEFADNESVRYVKLFCIRL